MLKALKIDYEKEKVKVDLSKLCPNTPSANSPSVKGWQPKADRVVTDTPLKEGNIDIAETLSNLTGKWIKEVKGQKSKVKGQNSKGKRKCKS